MAARARAGFRLGGQGSLDHLADWLEHGASTGVAREIPLAGAFPSVGTTSEAHCELHKHCVGGARRNYAS
eukprot:3067915-Pyramimonas_sp.AAC.1